ncbi:hypothetical protein HAV15_002331 [Penicillium sp. str. |nr:hypothetical protein HAV15_002331 [Penicillium sp. str. \
MYSKPPAIRFSAASATAPPPSPAQNTPMVARGDFFCRHQKEVKTLFWALQDTRGGFSTQSVLARAPTNPSMGVLLVVIAPAAELIVVTPSPPSTSSITLKPRGGSSTCFLTRTMAPWGRG